MSFTIKVLDHNYLQLINYPESVKRLLSYTQKSYTKWNKQYKFKQFSLIDFGTDTTYAGLLGLLKDEYPSAVIEDLRVFPEVELQVPNLSKELRKYQIDYLIAALKKKRMIIHSATGSGKTLIMAPLICSLPSLPTLIIAPNKTVMAQLHTELTSLCLNRKFGRLSGECSEWDDKLLIGLPQTLIKVPVDDLQKFKMVLVDEAHTAAANTVHDIILSTNAPYRYGFTGTPTGRSDNRDLVVQGLLGEVVQLIEREELVQKGYLAHTTVNFHRGWFEGDYIALEDLLIVNNPIRNKLILKIVNNYKKETMLILVRRLEHGKLLQKMIGNESVFLDGDSDIEEREDVRRDIKNGKLRILIATKIFGTGLDIPQLEVGINAKGGKAEIDTGQGVGRVVRPWNEVAKTWIDIYDEWTTVLEDHSKERIKAYKDQGIPMNFVGFTQGKEDRLKQL